MADGIRHSSFSRQRIQTYCPLWRSTTCPALNLAHITTLKWALCAFYKESNNGSIKYPDQPHYRSSLWPRGQQNSTSPFKCGLQTLNMRKEETRAAVEKTRLLMRAARDDRLFLFRAVFRLFENKAWICGSRCFLNSNRSLNLFIVVFSLVDKERLRHLFVMKYLFCILYIIMCIYTCTCVFVYFL